MDKKKALLKICNSIWNISENSFDSSCKSSIISLFINFLQLDVEGDKGKVSI